MKENEVEGEKQKQSLGSFFENIGKRSTFERLILIDWTTIRMLLVFLSIFAFRWHHQILIFGQNVPVARFFFSFRRRHIPIIRSSQCVVVFFFKIFLLLLICEICTINKKNRSDQSFSKQSKLFITFHWHERSKVVANKKSSMGSSIKQEKN